MHPAQNTTHSLLHLFFFSIFRSPAQNILTPPFFFNSHFFFNSLHPSQNTTHSCLHPFFFLIFHSPAQNTLTLPFFLIHHSPFFFQTLLLTPHSFFSIFTPHGFLILHSICFSTHTSSFGSSSSTSFFPFSFLFSMEKGDGEFGWFVMDGYGTCGYQESFAWYKKRLWYQLHNILLNFTLNLCSNKEKKIWQIHN